MKFLIIHILIIYFFLLSETFCRCESQPCAPPTASVCTRLADKNTASIKTGVVRRDGRDTALMFTLEL